MHPDSELAVGSRTGMLTFTYANNAWGARADGPHDWQRIRLVIEMSRRQPA
jgi:hypothetical protein